MCNTLKNCNGMLVSHVSPTTNYRMFLVICELIDKWSESLGGNHDGVDRTIGDKLNKVIVGVNKGSKPHVINHPQGCPQNRSSSL